MIKRFLIAVLFGVGFGVQAEPVSIEHDGLKLNGELQLADGQTIGDGVVMLVHGSMAHHRMEIIATLQELLVDAGYNTLAVNLSLAVNDRGASMFDCASVHRHRLEDAVGEIASWMAWLKQQGSGPVVLLGHSLGGNQVARYATQQPAPELRAMVLMAPPVHDVSKRRDKHQAVIEQARAAVERGDPDAVIEVPAFLHCPATQASAAAVMSYLHGDQGINTVTLLSDPKVPTLVMVGSADEVVAGLEAGVRPLADADRVELVVIEDAGHFFRDLYAEEAVEAIDAFIQEH